MQLISQPVTKSFYSCEICGCNESYELILFGIYRIRLCHPCDRMFQNVIIKQPDFRAYSAATMTYINFSNNGQQKEANECHQLIIDIQHQLGFFLESFIITIKKELKKEKKEPMLFKLLKRLKIRKDKNVHR